MQCNGIIIIIAIIAINIIISALCIIIIIIIIIFALSRACLTVRFTIPEVQIELGLRPVYFAKTNDK